MTSISRMKCKGLHTPLGREKRGSSPTFSTRAVIISSNLLPYQNGYLPCRIALFVIGVQVRMGLIKGVQFLYGASMLHYGLLIKLSEVWLQEIETGLTYKEK